MPEDDKNATLMREMLQQSQQATQDLIAALPQMLATALAGAPGGAAGSAGGADGGGLAGMLSCYDPLVTFVTEKSLTSGMNLLEHGSRSSTIIWPVPILCWQRDRSSPSSCRF